MREVSNMEQTVPAEGEARRSRRSRSREAFRQRQKKLAEEKKGPGRKDQEAAGAGQGPGRKDQEAAGAGQGPGRKDQEAAGAGQGPGRKDQEAAGAGQNQGQEAPPSGRLFLRKAVPAALILAAVFLAGGYIYKSLGYRDTYLPHTAINGTDVSGKTVDEVKSLISSGVRDYSLVLKLRGDGSETITGDSIGLHTVFDGSLEEIIRQQNPYIWPRYLLKGPSYDIRTMIVYDEGSLGKTMESLVSLDESQAETPADAYLSDYVKGQGYSIMPETEGNTLDEEKVKAEVVQGIAGLSSELDLDALGCYRSPSVRMDNALLTAARDARNRYVNMTVTYTFGSNAEVLDGEEIHQWLAADGENVSLDTDKAAEYVKRLASRYNTAYKKRSFDTSYGQTVELGGFYGWRINQGEETKALLDILEAGTDVTREPVYAQTAASHDGPDYGNTYAEVNLTAQHLLFYKDGEKILESDFVSGNVSKGHTTPPGIFPITYKQRDATLKGQGYASPVKYWMPFNGGIGFHDAGWRSSFGGAIYKSGGSHGCINMPYDAARQLFDNVYTGMPVICYDLPGTESSKSSQTAGKSPQGTTAPTQPVPTAPAETVPAETTPDQVAPAESAPDQSVPGQIGPGQTAPAETGPGQTGSGQTGSGQTGPGQTGSGQAGSGQTGPGQTGSGQTGPGQTAPDQSQGNSAETSPAGTAPAGAAPAQTTPQPSQTAVIIQPVG